MVKQKRQQRCWRYSFKGEILLNKYYTLGDTFCQEERLSAGESNRLEKRRTGASLDAPALCLLRRRVKIRESVLLANFGGKEGRVLTVRRIFKEQGAHGHGAAHRQI
jgi:hypothetical protein